ncbi:LacI family DNA-binding transcriptional regulator [Aliiroseovarius sp. PTFE2010]|uniref:LacI family DNA-binding transcriptional regulator n=1 Tax=Aliiroseovarius sp. PTFE2010 TaxID=3417190 RepID=UPI003CF719F6
MGDSFNQKTPKRVTIADVADYLGVTKGTVSRALNGYPDISKSTRRKVEQATRDLGYRPLAQAQAIRTGRVRAIGLVLQTYDHDGQRPFLADFLQGISQVASEENWTLTLATAPDRAALIPTLDQLITERKADGFILPRTMADDPRVSYLRGRGVPFILYGRVEDREGCGWFDIASETAIGEAVSRLTKLGHRRIGFVHGDDRYMFVRLRKAGYLAGLRDAGLPLDDRLIVANASSEAQGRAATDRLLDLPDPPTAIIFATDLAAFGAYAAAASRGVVIGRDLSIVGYDGQPEGRRLTPPLASFAVDNKLVGQELAGLLIRHCRGDAPESLRRTACAAWMPGASVGPAPSFNQNTHFKDWEVKT